MFVLDKSPSYSWPVQTEVASNNGKFETETFDVNFKRVTESEKMQFFGAETVQRHTDVEICKKVVVGWKGVTDENGNEIPFSQENLDKLLEIPKVSSFIVIAFLESLAGARVKNS